MVRCGEELSAGGMGIGSMLRGNGTSSFWDDFLGVFAEFFSFEFPEIPIYEYVMNSIFSLLMVCFAGLMSGLTLGLLSFDKMTLEIYKKGRDKKKAARAKKIDMLTKHHHWLLCTLLMCNAMAMEALPLFLDTMLPSLLSVGLSVSLVLVCGEILPQAVCSRYGLIVGASSFYLVAALMIITFPLSWPLGKLLDCFLGKNHVTFFRRAQLKELVALHGTEDFSEVVNENSPLIGIHPKKKKRDTKFNINQKGGGKRKFVGHGPLSRDEINVIRGALELSEKSVADVMTRIDRVYRLEVDRKLDLKLMTEILKKGHSRIPIYEKNVNNVIGLLIVKNLILLDPDDAIPIRNCDMRRIIGVRDSYKLYEMINCFQEERSHIALVFEKEEDIVMDFCSHKYKKLIGVVTLEDCLEEIIKEEIVDEHDNYVDMNTHLTVADHWRRVSVYALSAGSTKSALKIGKGEEKDVVVLNKEEEKKGKEKIQDILETTATKVVDSTSLELIVDDGTDSDSLKTEEKKDDSKTEEKKDDSPKKEEKKD